MAIMAMPMAISSSRNRICSTSFSSLGSGRHRDSLPVSASMNEDAQMVVVERQRLFNRIAPVYDNLNDWLSIGQHRIWKRMAVSWSGAKPGDCALDICCGSGDLVFIFAEKVGSTGQVTGLDFAEKQLSLAKKRQRDSSCFSNKTIKWILGDALNLPFENATFDAITMGYGLRNVVDIPRALEEIHRVLKPGRKACILDFNHSENNFVNELQGWILGNIVVPVATLFQLQDDYEYIRSSILRFPTGRDLKLLAMKSGFAKAEHYEFGGNFMGALVLTKDSREN